MSIRSNNEDDFLSTIQMRQKRQDDSETQRLREERERQRQRDAQLAEKRRKD